MPGSQAQPGQMYTFKRLSNSFSMIAILYTSTHIFLMPTELTIRCSTAGRSIECPDYFKGDQCSRCRCGNARGQHRDTSGLDIPLTVGTSGATVNCLKSRHKLALVASSPALYLFHKTVLQSYRKGSNRNKGRPTGQVEAYGESGCYSFCSPASLEVPQHAKPKQRYRRGLPEHDL